MGTSHLVLSRPAPRSPHYRGLWAIPWMPLPMRQFLAIRIYLLRQHSVFKHKYASPHSCSSEHVPAVNGRVHSWRSLPVATHAAVSFETDDSRTCMSIPQFDHRQLSCLDLILSCRTAAEQGPLQRYEARRFTTSDPVDFQ